MSHPYLLMALCALLLSLFGLRHGMHRADSLYCAFLALPRDLSASQRPDPADYAVRLRCIRDAFRDAWRHGRYRQHLIVSDLLLLAGTLLEVVLLLGGRDLALRFVLLHAGDVVIAGAIGGMLLFPFTYWAGYALRFPYLRRGWPMHVRQTSITLSRRIDVQQ